MTAPAAHAIAEGMPVPDGSLLSRRRLLVAGAVTLAGAGLPRRAAGSVTGNVTGGFADVPLRPIDFEVLRGGAAIGSHRVRFERRGDRLEVRMQIDIAVRILGLTVYSYRQDSLETWVGERLHAYDSDTTEDDARFVVVGRAGADGFDVTAKKERAVAPADIMIASYWTPAICIQTRLIEPKRGRLREQQVLGEVPVEVRIGGTVRPAREFRIAGILDGSCTYDEAGRWVGARFRKRDSEIVYQLQD